MKKIIKFLLPLFAAGVMAGSAVGQELKSEVFGLLDMGRPGLEKVRALHEAGDDKGAAKALLEYYRARTGVATPDVDLSNVRIGAEERKWADEAMEHTFFVHKGYQPSFNYGEDIDWRYWPVKDNELRWQLHRHKWFTPMGKAYRVTGDEKYAKEWVAQYVDWIRKNPLVKISKQSYEQSGDEKLKGDAENARFAWRPLEVSNRLQDQTSQFQLFLTSEHFTPEFLTEFLVNYHRHAEHIMGNYSTQGNHLLFEAQRMIYAGAFFPEFSDAAEWRKSGVEILNDEIGKQVLPDGGQYELDPHYHLASINIFCKGLEIAAMNGFREDFPQSYIDVIERMVVFYANICFPDYSNPCFSDAKMTKKEEMLKNYGKWSKLFPENEFIRYLATEGRKGALPDYLSKGFADSGFFVFRNQWKAAGGVQMVVKAGPPAFWHNQPDNGTFELWFNGRNLFPDSGSYVYAGDDEVMKLREWFRQTMVHNTLTLDDRTIEVTDSRTRLWQPEGEVQVLVTENPAYLGLTHRRSVFFVDNAYFVIVDEAFGNAEGTVNLHYQLCEGKVEIDKKNMVLSSGFKGGSNVKLQCFSPAKLTIKEEEGWRSTDYRVRKERTAVSFNAGKKEGDAVRFITVIYPAEDAAKAPKFAAEFKDKGFDDRGLEVEVTVGGVTKRLKYELK